MTDFDLLRTSRKEVAEFVRLHAPSVGAFRAAEHDWFKIDAEEPSVDVPVSHKTTTASCIESLADLAAAGHGNSVVPLATAFASHALDQSPDNWQSEGAAWVYCRARTLPAILAYAELETLQSRTDVLRDHVEFVWGNVDVEPRHQAIYERSSPEEVEDQKESPEYPPNAFHTFWALRTLQLAHRVESLTDSADALHPKRRLAILWTQNMLATQVALYHARSERADPHQLAWALAAQFTGEGPPDELSAGEFVRPDLYRAGLDAFFGQQRESGSWPLGQPIFHYPQAGNAYCYTFETLTELLRPALHASRGGLYRDMLRPHLPGLLAAWEYARRTAVPLSTTAALGDEAVGWCSGHHPHRTYPEGWATAVTFSFLQCFRRLIGMWTRDEAARELGVRPARHETRAKALGELAGRGRTWTGGERWSAGEQLAALFLHPVDALTPSANQADPDLPLVEADQARSAILFGPPGTSKTSLAEALAGAIGWDFVEVHASDFLREGMDKVPGLADAIFSKLMELDRCVVLFDEIDELLRERKGELDPFGRFLTTSMLPKVARLWEQRRVLFFVATNDIRAADDAILRSQRFDAAIFVAPPSFNVKRDRLRALFGNDTPPFDEAAVEHDLSQAGQVPTEHPLGYFALLRWDQIDEFADLIKENPGDLATSKEALRQLGGKMEPDNGETSYSTFRQQQRDERRDHRSLRLLSASLGDASLPGGFDEFRRTETDLFIRIDGSERRPPETIEIDGADVPGDALLRYRSDGVDFTT